MVAEWAMVAGLSAILFALTLQLVFALHVRNVLIDAASHGARYGTLADRGPADARERTRELITGSVGARFAGDVTAVPAEVQGLRAVAVLLVVLYLGIPRDPGASRPERTFSACLLWFLASMTLVTISRSGSDVDAAP